ncbi:MAG TPA: cyclopentanol dehydrogenase [Sphaerochaeta sp.]|nr:cyclopentanol dehydrogenase [Sphaerochaeta sp.]
MKVLGKTIVITGGCGGLGSEMGELLASQGATVYLLDLDQEKGIALQEQLKGLEGRVVFEKMDITSPQEWERVVSHIVEKEGHLDVLVNNAGINIRKGIEEMALSEWNTMMLVNVGSVFLGTKQVIPVMRNQGGGVIINTSSVCGLIGHRYTPEAYTTTKGAVTLLTKSIASRYAKDGIRCNSIHPSTVDTPLVQEMFKDPVKRQQRLDEVPLGRLAKASDVANAVLYLASDEASFINGIAMPVDGGVTCC